MNDPKPGSDEVLAQGRTCPVLANAHGRGALGSSHAYWVDMKCPLHGGRNIPLPPPLLDGLRENATEGK